jgi:hypothetical protein
MRSYLIAACAAGATAILLAANPAAAECNPDNAIFEDDFEFMDASWGQPNENVFVEDGALVVKGGWGQVNFQTTSEAADFCVDTTIVEAADPDGGFSDLLVAGLGELLFCRLLGQWHVSNRPDA